ncbi:hypothetical protein [Streptomyces longwoodensis]|uniref:hypothetical protein n=1 Tax=Streptomyces longwoodensis TaxID=68231 RepID=UPI00381C4CCC
MSQNVDQFRRTLEDTIETEISSRVDDIARDVVTAVWNAVDDQIGEHRQYVEDAGQARDFARRQTERIAAKRDLAEIVLDEWESGRLVADQALRMIRSALAVGEVKTLDQLRSTIPAP